MIPGTKLGPYEILTPLGAGGMGEVYRARDSRLEREVAVKVLPEHLAQDPDALARFEREAKAVASGGSYGRPASEAIDSIVVIPFANASRDPEVDYLCDGITETIINSLTRWPGLRVTPRSTAFRYKGQDVDPQSICRELGARAVLTGRIVQRGETLVVGTASPSGSCSPSSFRPWDDGVMG